MNNKIRSVIIHLNDGRYLTFSGPEQIPDHELATLSIVKTEFTHAKKLPNNTYWEEVKRVDTADQV